MTLLLTNAENFSLFQPILEYAFFANHYGIYYTFQRLLKSYFWSITL